MGHRCRARAQFCIDHRPRDSERHQELFVAASARLHDGEQRSRMLGGVLMTRITKAAIAWSAVCVIWLIVGLIYAASRPWYDEVDKGRLVGQVIGTWIVGLVVIAFIWFVTAVLPQDLQSRQAPVRSLPRRRLRRAAGGLVRRRRASWPQALVGRSSVGDHRRRAFLHGERHPARGRRRRQRCTGCAWISEAGARRRACRRRRDRRHGRRVDAGDPTGTGCHRDCRAGCGNRDLRRHLGRSRASSSIAAGAILRELRCRTPAGRALLHQLRPSLTSALSAGDVARGERSALGRLSGMR